jgi:hypothetical protein
VPLDEIDCFVAEDGYVMARSARVEGFVDASLQELEERLGDAVLRVHRGCLVVKEAVAGVERCAGGGCWVVFRDCLEGVGVSRRQMPLLRSPVIHPVIHPRFSGGGLLWVTPPLIHPKRPPTTESLAPPATQPILLPQGAAGPNGAQPISGSYSRLGTTKGQVNESSWIHID